MRKDIFTTGLMVTVMTLCSCADNEVDVDTSQRAKGTPINVVALYPTATKATATDFEDGDRIGLYMAEDEKGLELSGNLVNNEPLTLKSNKWSGRRTLYWDEGRYNAYAYYPYQDIVSTEDQPFGVATDQTTAETTDRLGGYEASDFLFAVTKGVTAGQSPITLSFRHIMSRLTIRLVKGEDFEGDMPNDAEVYIHNTVTTATIDLAAGIATQRAE